MLRSASLFVVLFAFWLLLSGKYDFRDSGERYLMICGVVCSLFVTWVATRKGILDEEGHPIQIAFRFLLYFPWLLWQIILSNLDVAYRIWHPNRPISPKFIRVPYETHSDLGTVIFANSITLTPGTVTVSVDEENREFLVHALTEKAAASLLSGKMHEKVKKVEGSP